MSLALIEQPSPNHGPRAEGVTVDLLLVHYTGMPTLEIALERLCSPASGVSAHYTIAFDGRIWRHVPEERRAWHAGVSAWGAARDINSCSIGIELENRGYEWGYQRFAPAQMESFRLLARQILARHPIPPARVLGHADVAWARKQDPGEWFAWRELAAEGIGLWPAPLAVDEGPAGPGEVADLLRRYGYHVPDEAALPLVISAFQRHFRPEAVTGEADRETVARLRALMRQLGSVLD